MAPNIEELARRCGAHPNTDFDYGLFAQLVAEECAKVCDLESQAASTGSGAATCEMAAMEIRSMFKTGRPKTPAT